LPLEDFGRRRSSRDGHASRCRSCKNAEAKLRRDDPILGPIVREQVRRGGKKWLAGGTAYTFDIQADGAWSVSADLIGTQGGSSFSGKGFDVSGTFTPPTAPTAFAFTHTGRRNFIVTLNCDGAYADLIQNEIGQVSGSRIVRFPQGASTCFWEVEADGNWTIKPQA